MGNGAVEEPAPGVEVQDPRAELVADPEVAVAAALQGLGVDVPAGEQPGARALADDREADPVEGVAERDVVADVDRAGPSVGRLEVGTKVVGADQEVDGVGLAAEAVVGHREDLAAVPSVDDRREPFDRLPGRGKSMPLRVPSPRC